MNLFDQLVESALASRPSLSTLRPAVEKEILHHDVLREMSNAGLLDSLTFIGGTCLRDCYGSARLSEDLDFTGGDSFDKHSFSGLKAVLESGIRAKYGLEVHVDEPRREVGNVDTWKIKVITRAAQAHLPVQRINIDICAIRSHSRHPVMIRNHYGTDFGTSGLILSAQSLDEILADKVLALGLRPNRIKYRDIWDILWLLGQGIQPDSRLVAAKLTDRQADAQEFRAAVASRLEGLSGAAEDYLFEMRRFLPSSFISDIEKQSGYWSAVLNLLRDTLRRAI